MLTNSKTLSVTEMLQVLSLQKDSSIQSQNLCETESLPSIHPLSGVEEEDDKKPITKFEL